MSLDHIRNFCILAHIDHGKSTLADRFLELTGTVEKRKMHEQYLDMHPLEREKGITIKMQPVRMNYKLQMPNAEKENSNSAFSIQHSEFILNLIDTPGHVDFTYEVSRALAAVEGGLLLVDATQGVQAQTLANLHLAQKEGLVIIPVINKIDLPSADIGRTEEEIMTLLGCERKDIYNVSAKEGTGVEELLRGIIEKIPPPLKNAELQIINAESEVPLRALIFDSKFDSYQGVIAHVRIIDGSIKKNDLIYFVATGAKGTALDIGFFTPNRVASDELNTGEIGYIATGLKESEKVRVGDTISAFSIHNSELAVEPLPGYREPVPMIFASMFPENQDEYDVLRDGLKKLKLEDAALLFEPEDSAAFGRGFRTGFLGMLHMEIISERLRREFDLELVFSNPSVAFRIKTAREYKELKRDDDGYSLVYSASKFPPQHEILEIQEPHARVEIITPPEYLGALTSVISDREGLILETVTISAQRLSVHFEAPLREIIVDFYDELKSMTRGYASMAYELAGYQRADLVRMDMLVAGEQVSTLAEVLPREKVYRIARARVEKLKELLPRELFAIALQAEVEGRIIARETIPALKKDVTGYLYGGDRTRKMKLWKKQQRGKKRLKETARVTIPPEVFIKMLKK